MTSKVYAEKGTPHDCELSIR